MNSEIIMYQSEDGQTKIDVTVENETVWISLDQMASLFQRDKSTISRHIKNIFQEGELIRNSVVANFATTASDGKVYQVDHYNLDVIISVGYRVKSHRGTQFRLWATERLKEYIIKGFTMNDDLLKNAGGGTYWKELLERIRDIRSSEKIFYRQVLDIYATSVDYDPNTDISQMFFQTVQNKMHFAAHGNTAAEILFQRANAELPFMGMTTFKDKKPTKTDALSAKNYLKEDEIAVLNRLVSSYLDFAELQAMRRNPMYMKDWIEKLDDFIKLTGSELLQNAGSISHKKAEKKVRVEYERYKQKTFDELSQVEIDYFESLKQTQKKLEGKNNIRKNNQV